jgi:low affinity Fe/Cu permease
MSRVVRIDEEALEVALQYGKNLSAGIMKMEEMLKKQEKAKRDYTAIEEMVRRTIREELEVLTSRY